MNETECGTHTNTIAGNELSPYARAVVAAVVTGVQQLLERYADSLLQNAEQPAGKARVGFSAILSTELPPAVEVRLRYVTAVVDTVVIPIEDPNQMKLELDHEEPSE